MWQQLADGMRAASALEFASLACGVLYALLAVRRVRACWLFGAASSLILIYLSWVARLPMQAALQLCYVAMAVYGFWHWSRSRQADAVQLSRWPLRRHAAALAALALLTLLLSPLVAAQAAAAWPRLDTLTMLAGLLATWMTARAQLENWLYWIAIDLLSVYLYAAQGLLFIAVLYAVYTAIAIAGWFAWRSQWLRQQRMAAAAR
jgi:nicotinamide mononucleotide transporter